MNHFLIKNAKLTFSLDMLDYARPKGDIQLSVLQSVPTFSTIKSSKLKRKNSVMSRKMK